MNTETAPLDTDVNTDVENTSLESGTGNEAEERLAALESQVQSLTAEATKQRKLKQAAIKERDEARKSKPNNDDENRSNYKSLYEQEKAQKEMLLGKTRDASIDAAVAGQLTKLGVLPDAVKAASKLLDKDLIEWDMQEGLDQGSVEASVAKLRYDYPMFFEKKVPATNPKQPTDKAPSSNKEMTRSEFDDLSIEAQSQRMTSGWKLIDD